MSGPVVRFLRPESLKTAPNKSISHKDTIFQTWYLYVPDISEVRTWTKIELCAARDGHQYQATIHFKKYLHSEKTYSEGDSERSIRKGTLSWCWCDRPVQNNFIYCVSSINLGYYWYLAHTKTTFRNITTLWEVFLFGGVLSLSCRKNRTRGPDMQYL